MQSNRRTVLHLLLVALYIFVALIALKEYLEWTSVNFIIGVAVMPVMFSVKNKNKSAYRFAILALILMIAGIIVPVKTILYLTLSCILLFFYESSGGTVSALPLLTFFMISPVCQYFSHIFSFPIRLWLTHVAGSLLKNADQDVMVAGNIISFNENDFSVDPACMGLNMLVTSLLCGLIMLAFYLKRKELVLKAQWIMISLILIFLLNIVANLLRILLLVYFKIMPDNFMHGITGIICLMIYVLLPGSFLLKIIVSKFGKPLKGISPGNNRNDKVLKYMHFLLLPFFVFLAMHTFNESVVKAEGILPQVAGYHISWYDKEVIKMENDHALVYIKPLKGFVYTDHNPLICWTGSGYTFQNIQEQEWSGISLFTGVLNKGKERLFTAWWYDNGNITTISQWTWRWQMFQHQDAFSIINVSANNLEDLKCEVATIAGRRSSILVRVK